MTKSLSKRLHWLVYDMQMKYSITKRSSIKRSFCWNRLPSVTRFIMSRYLCSTGKEQQTHAIHRWRREQRNKIMQNSNGAQRVHVKCLQSASSSLDCIHWQMMQPDKRQSNKRKSCLFVHIYLVPFKRHFIIVIVWKMHNEMCTNSSLLLHFHYGARRTERKRADLLQLLCEQLAELHS